MNIKKAIKLYKQGMKFSDIMELCDLNSEHMKAVDYGTRSNQPEWKIAQVANQTHEDIKAIEIEQLFN